MGVLRRLAGTVIGILYVLGAGFRGAMEAVGHGTYAWFLLFFPFLIGGLFYPLAGFLVADLRSRTARLVLGWTLLVNYLLTGCMLIILQGDFRWIAIRSPRDISFFAGIYAAGHIVIWALFIRSLLAKDAHKSDDEIVNSLK